LVLLKMAICGLPLWLDPSKGNFGGCPVLPFERLNPSTS